MDKFCHEGTKTQQFAEFFVSLCLGGQILSEWIDSCKKIKL